MFIFSLSSQLRRLSVTTVTTFLLLCTPFTISAAENFELTTTPNLLISLKADNASLKAVVEQIAQTLNIKLETTIGDSELISADFDKLPLERALQRISPNFITITEKEGGKIAKIFLLPQGQEAPRIVTNSRPPATAATKAQNSDIRKAGPEPFRFEFDPSAVMNAQ